MGEISAQNVKPGDVALELKKLYSKEVAQMPAGGLEACCEEASALCKRSSHQPQRSK